MMAGCERGRCSLRSGGIFVAASARRHLSDQWLVESAVTDGLHHGEMLEVVVGLEQSIACKELDENAAYAPYIAWEAPAQVQDDFGCSVMSSGND